MGTFSGDHPLEGRPQARFANQPKFPISSFGEFELIWPGVQLGEDELSGAEVIRRLTSSRTSQCAKRDRPHARLTRCLATGCLRHSLAPGVDPGIKGDVGASAHADGGNESARHADSVGRKVPSRSAGARSNINLLVHRLISEATSFDGRGRARRGAGEAAASGRGGLPGS
jgi:hypothetical protein